MTDPAPALPFLQALRKSLAPDTLQTRLRAAIANGFQVAVARQGTQAVRVAGFRFQHDTFWGRILYFNNKIVAPDLRSSGIGKRLPTDLRERAIHKNCDHMRFCSGLDRKAAHAF